MTLFRLALRNLRFHRRMHGWVLAGVALASMILTGALVVGDSVDYSLRSYALARLVGIHVAVDARPRLFAERLADELGKRVEGSVGDETLKMARDAYGNGVAALTLRGMAIHGGESGEATQVNGVSVVGVSEPFWMLQLPSALPEEEPTSLMGILRTAAEGISVFTDHGIGAQLGPNETALNERLASVLGAKVGDEMALRLEKPGLFSRDAPLSSRGEDASRRVRCVVKWILPDNGIGRFSLSASQTPPYNAFVNLQWLQEELEATGQVNLALVFEGATEDNVTRALAESWQLEDVGLRLRRHASGVVQLESDRIFLDTAIAETALALPDATGALTYLVNKLAKGERSTPYSFVVAGPVPSAMKDDEVLINRWLADALDAGRGDEIVVTYSELLPSNDFVEKTRSFRVCDVVEMDALRVERELAPVFPGLSDVERCEDWNVGMPMDEELLKDKANEAYWNEYGQTPKALFTLAAGREMWSTRFGGLMAVRYPEKAEAPVREALQRDVAPEEVGLRVVPAREEALAAVSQAMDLGGLFLGMSFFLIVSALILTALLFVFGVQQRAEEMGTLLALGFTPAHVRWIFLMEAAAIAVLGSCMGAWAATLYTRALLAGLTHYWQGAVAYTAIQYHTTPSTLAQGAAIGAVSCVAALAAAMTRQTRHSARELLTMDFTQDATRTAKQRRPGLGWPLCGLGLAFGIVFYAFTAEPNDATFLFFGAGASLLLGGVGLCRFALGRMGGEAGEVRELTFVRLAMQNAARRRGRGLSVVALLSTGCFLVLAVSAMQENIGADAQERWAGTGGFELFAESTVPLTENPADEFAEPTLNILSIRVRDGDDASCLNLNRAQTPRLLGVNAAKLSDLKAFMPKEGDTDLWRLLDMELPGGAIPALAGDSDTAIWGLKKRTGVEDGGVLVYRDETGHDVTVKLVGSLPMRLSVFQGTVLVSEAAFTRLYPSEDGFRMFLVDTPSGAEREWAARLKKRFAKAGFDPTDTVERLRQFYVVESTYLGMFLALGGLGMILGSAAIGVVALRNLLERRREAAILRALGFRERTLFRLFAIEYGLLLFWGVLIGAAAAGVAITPTLHASGSSVSLGVQGLLVGLIALCGLISIAAGLRAGLGKGDTGALRDE